MDAVVARQARVTNLDMDELRTFVAIIDHMSFSRAGESIGLSQSAVSLRLRRLEQSLGVSLLVRRQGRVVELTPAGTSMLAYARKIVGLNDIALHQVAAKPLCSHIRLGLPADLLDAAFPEALAKVRSLLPGFEVEIETDVSERLRARCLAGQLDLAFYKIIQPDEAARPLLRLPMAWMAKPGTPWVPGDPVGIVCFPEGCVYRRLMEETLNRSGIQYRVVFVTPSLEALCRAVAAGMGVTALPAAKSCGVAPAGLPALSDVALAMMVAAGCDPRIQRSAGRLAEALVAQWRRRHRSPG